MAKGASYCAPYRRRREGKTDYRARKASVLSGRRRLVIRSSLKNLTAQIVVAKPIGDEILVSAHSHELARKYGWRAPRGNLPTAYLTGFLCGSKAKAQGIEEAISDIGLNAPSKGARVFAALKGVLDAGMNIPHSEGKLPEEKRMEGEHIVQYAKSLVSNTEEYNRKFSGYLEQKLPPEDLSKNFAEVKKEIASAFKGGGKKV